jgi:hypothetical protein
MDPKEAEARNGCAGEGQQQSDWLILMAKASSNSTDRPKKKNKKTLSCSGVVSVAGQ